MKWTLALALLATTTTAEEPGLRDWFGAYSAPTIAGRGFAVSDRTVELGHLRLHFTGGALYPLSLIHI